MRIAIFGNSGSGKSSAAREAAKLSGIPVLDLDTIVWEPDRIAVRRPVKAIHAALQEFDGDLLLDRCKWVELGPPVPLSRHYLFYFRDETFECDAVDWSLTVDHSPLF